MLNHSAYIVHRDNNVAFVFGYTGALKTWEWKTRHQTAGVENAGVEKYGKPKVPVI